VLDAVTAGKSSVVGIEFGEMTVRVYDSAALVKGIVDVESRSGSVTHLDILHVWIHGPEGWQMVGRQAAKAL
jgi:hypothetical protein